MDTPHDRTVRGRGDSDESGVRSAGEPSTRYEKFPATGCVHWTPWKHWVSGNRFYSPYEIVVAQPVLATIREHIAADLDREVLGLLGGQLLVCPETLRRWIKVDQALDPVPPAPVGVNGENVEQALLPLVAEARGKGWSPIGWYHVCRRKSFTLSETEADIHARYFALPWHVLLLVLADLGRPAGGIFVRSESGRLSRSEYRPFYELIRDDARLTNGRLRTFVGWQNYMTDAPVVRAFSEADEVNGWNRPGPDRGSTDRGGSGRIRRTALAAAAVLALLASGWGLRDRLPPQPFDSLSGLIEFASPGEANVADDALAAPPSGTSVSDAEGTVDGDLSPSGEPAAPAPSTETAQGARERRFYSLAAEYGRAAAAFQRGEIDCRRLGNSLGAVRAAFARLAPASAEGDDPLFDIAGRLEQSIANGPRTDEGTKRSDPGLRMSDIESQFRASGCPPP